MNWGHVTHKQAHIPERLKEHQAVFLVLFESFWEKMRGEIMLTQH